MISSPLAEGSVEGTRVLRAPASQRGAEVAAPTGGRFSTPVFAARVGIRLFFTFVGERSLSRHAYRTRASMADLDTLSTVRSASLPLLHLAPRRRTTSNRPKNQPHFNHWRFLFFFFEPTLSSPGYFFLSQPRLFYILYYQPCIYILSTMSLSLPRPCYLFNFPFVFTFYFVDFFRYLIATVNVQSKLPTSITKYSILNFNFKTVLFIYRNLRLFLSLLLLYRTW